MGIFGLGDDVQKDNNAKNQNKSDSDQTQKSQTDKSALHDKMKAKEDAETCEFC